MGTVFTEEDKTEMYVATREIGYLPMFGMEFEDVGDPENGPKLSATPPLLDQIAERIAHIDCTDCWGFGTCMVHFEGPDFEI